MSTEQQNGASPEQVVENALSTQPPGEIAQPQNIVLTIRGLDVLLNMSNSSEREQIRVTLQNYIDASIREKVIAMSTLVQQIQSEL